MFFGGNKAQKPQAARKLDSGTGLAAPTTIFDCGIADFEQSVIVASMNIPVIVDFWASWCGPCKQLMPVLEKVVAAAGGQVLLAKVNIDDNQELAAMMRVQSVPTVYAFFQGQPVDGFQGAQPESKIKVFVEKLLTLARSAQPDALDIPDALKGAAQTLAAGDAAAAQAVYIQILQQDPMNAQAYVGMVRCFIAVGQIEQAKGLVASAPEAITKTPTFAEARTALDLAINSPAEPMDKLKAKVEANPKDHQARIDLALALFSKGRREEATESLLESIALDRAWNEQAARKELLKLFDAMGHTDPVTLGARRKLSSILFS